LIINSSTVGMESARTYRSTTTRTLSFSAAMLNFGEAQNTLDDANVTEGTPSENPQEAFEKLGAKSPLSARLQLVRNPQEESALSKIRHHCIWQLWEMLFGKKCADDMARDYGFTETPNATVTPMNAIQITATQEYHFEETESTSFSTTGIVKTADGREINFNVDVAMSRSFSEYYSEEVTQIANMCDPLVINLDQSIAGLSDQKFFFDLDMNGEAEEISMPEKGNGFLSLDLNEDGIINDGSELFGARNGDGFADLAKYDEDGNGWIDEADSVYKKLRIWVKDPQGNDALYTLKEKDVGAIYLGNANTDFTLRGETGDVNGAIRKTGIFLYENGTAGTISHLDIAN